MKKLLFIFTFLSLVFTLNAQIDLSKKPEPLPETPFTFPEYTIETLSNGMKVFIVQDLEQPTVSFRMMFAGGSSMDGKKSGTADFLSEMIMKGTKNMTALQLAQKIEGIGASINANAGTDNFSLSGSSLKKHGETILDLMNEVLTESIYPKDEFKKLIPRFLANIKNEKSNPMAVGGKLARRILYGEDHPYGMRPSEESIKSIELNDVIEYQKKYLIPNNATMVVVGDIDKEKIIKLLEKKFANWKKGELPKISIPKTNPAPLGVYFVNRPTSVQSTIMVMTKAIPANHEDYETLQIASSLIGSGFGGRLFKTLREKHSYTYTPFGRLSSNKYANTFACGADVRNSVTDSALNVIFEQINLLNAEVAPDDELNRILKSEVGEFQMAFESAGFIASLLQNADFIGEPIDKVKDYPKRISSLSPYDIQRVAAKYMNPSSAYIFVVGNPDVKDKLAKFGKVYDYDLNLNPLSGENAKLEKISMDASDLIEKYTKAIGGKDELAKVTSIITEGKATVSIQGQNMEGTVLIKQKSPKMKFQNIDIGMIKQQIWTDGTNAWGGQAGNVQKLDGKQLEKSIEDAIMFKETQLLTLGNKCQVLGKQGNEILMKVSNDKGDESVYYFDATSYFINKVEETESTPQGPIPVTVNYSKYEKFNGIAMPKQIETTNPIFTISVDVNYKLNEMIEDKEFRPENN